MRVREHFSSRNGHRPRFVRQKLRTVTRSTAETAHEPEDRQQHDGAEDGHAEAGEVEVERLRLAGREPVDQPAERRADHAHDHADQATLPAPVAAADDEVRGPADDRAEDHPCDETHGGSLREHLYKGHCTRTLVQLLLCVMEEKNVREIRDSKALAAMSHPLRRRLLDVLHLDGPATASTLAAQTGKAVGNVSHHLKVLAASELVE